MNLEIGILLFGVALVLLALFTIPIILKVSRALDDVIVMLKALNERLPVILQNLEEISTNVNQATTTINEETQKYRETSQRINAVMSDVAEGLEMIVPYVRQSAFFQKMLNLFAAVKGAGVFWKTLTEKEKE